jgi:hypothetical protein
MNKLAYKNYVLLPYHILLIYWIIIYSVALFVFNENKFKLVKNTILNSFYNLSFQTFEQFKILIEDKEIILNTDNAIFFDNKIISKSYLTPNEDYIKIYKYFHEVEPVNRYILEIEESISPDIEGFNFLELNILNEEVYQNFTEKIIKTNCYCEDENLSVIFTQRFKN